MEKNTEFMMLMVQVQHRKLESRNCFVIYRVTPNFGNKNLSWDVSLYYRIHKFRHERKSPFEI